MSEDMSGMDDRSGAKVRYCGESACASVVRLNDWWCWQVFRAESVSAHHHFGRQRGSATTVSAQPESAPAVRLMVVRGNFDASKPRHRDVTLPRPRLHCHPGASQSCMPAPATRLTPCCVVTFVPHAGDLM